ncbi:hypothetical protein PIB30_037535 [Stylosanthes scabra]|uniref:Uncharacterized protein n=1 Tax=Stylosanthes scabra TaxID=79078 RepID=A0ABU6RE94_9FABA|nr:hypothetical protein [Stylosanthes scabra]
MTSSIAYGDLNLPLFFGLVLLFYMKNGQEAQRHILGMQHFVNSPDVNLPRGGSLQAVREKHKQHKISQDGSIGRRLVLHRYELWSSQLHQPIKLL